MSGFAVRRVFGQVASDIPQNASLAILLIRRYVLGLEVDQLGEGSADVHAKPWHRCNGRVLIIRYIFAGYIVLASS